MESIAHLYDCTLDCNGEYRSPFLLYLRLSWIVSFTFLTVPKIVMESSAHLYDCTINCNGDYRSHFLLYLRLSWLMTVP